MSEVVFLLRQLDYLASPATCVRQSRQSCDAHTSLVLCTSSVVPRPSDLCCRPNLSYRPWSWPSTSQTHLISPRHRSSSLFLLQRPTGHVVAAPVAPDPRPVILRRRDFLQISYTAQTTIETRTRSVRSKHQIFRRLCLHSSYVGVERHFPCARLILRSRHACRSP